MTLLSWRAANGKRLLLRQMTTSHLVNTWLRVRRGGFDDEVLWRFAIPLQNELARRGLKTNDIVAAIAERRWCYRHATSHPDGSFHRRNDDEDIQALHRELAWQQRRRRPLHVQRRLTDLMVNFQDASTGFVADLFFPRAET